MKKRLNQIVAVESQVKTRTQEELTELHKSTQKGELFIGHFRQFQPRDDDPSSPAGERLPDEVKTIQAHSKEILGKTAELLAKMYDLNAAREWGNTVAKADLEVDGKVIARDVPVTYLLFLEKKLADVHTFVQKLPILDGSEVWEEHDREKGVYRTARTGSTRTRKTTRPMVLYEATKEHPAQVKEVTEDIFAGTWWTTKYSSALPASKKSEMLRRIEEMSKAVKFAREQANMTEVDEPKIGRALCEYLFGG